MSTLKLVMFGFDLFREMGCRGPWFTGSPLGNYV